MDALDFFGLTVDLAGIYTLCTHANEGRFLAIRKDRRSTR